MFGPLMVFCAVLFAVVDADTDVPAVGVEAPVPGPEVELFISEDANIEARST